jgi:cysteinyl-tRNA synthetase
MKLPEIFIYNTINQQKEIFKPIVSGQIKLYVCGITVYDYCHIGHARVSVAFDAIVKYLTWVGYEVNYVRNITDIDDKIIDRAKLNHETMEALTSRFIDFMHKDFSRLGISRPTLEPKATHHMAHIIDMIQVLVDKKMAYLGDNGDVYFAVEKYDAYGELSHRKLEELKAGERIEIVKSKHSPHDFVLWKKAKVDEPNWDSPWGAGRPGWHIECSAMSTHCLGERIDIHGGGFDLIFPHHENERAQSEGATGQKFVNYWMHVGFVQVNDQKMAKSLKNFFTIREVLAVYHPEVVRLFLLSSHYRSPINYTEDGLENAKKQLS